jgi:hypothetical protein
MYQFAIRRDHLRFGYCGVRGMTAIADIRQYVEEAQTCIEAALVAGEAVAVHGIVPSQDFERVMEQLRLALETLDNAKLPEDVVRLPTAVRI